MARSTYIACGSDGRLAKAPRFTYPLSFLSRVPYSIALMAMALGLVLVCGPLMTEAGPRDDLAPVNDPLNFTQVVNHFDSLDGRTFHQRYWVNPRWWKVPEQAQASPMALLRINSFHWDGDWNTSTIATWAQELGAIVYDLEPRYAGQSYPVPDVATSDLRYYSIEQNVADVVNFIREQSSSLPNNTRWVVMGSLFDGAFATWVSAKPRVAFGVVAVSPYLLAVESYTGYDLAYQAAIGRTCSRVIHSLLETASYALNTSAESRASFQTQCGVAADDLLPNAEFMYVLSTILLGSLDADSITVCKTFADVQTSDNATRLNTLANFVVQYNEQNWMTFVGWDFARDTGGNRTDPGAGFRPSYYLQCTQLGQFQVSSGTEYSLLPAEVNLDWYLSVCQKLFSNLTAARPNVDVVNANFGGAVPEGCNMAFALSPNNPYAGLGPDAASLAADQATTGNKIVQINCPEAQVGLSLFSPPASSGDPACLGQARSDILQTLKLWQTQEDTCPSSTSTDGGGGGGGGGHDDGDMALVGVFSAVGGGLLALVLAAVLFAFFGRRFIQKWKASFFSKIN